MVLQLVAAGHSSKQIALTFCISLETVEPHRRTIMMGADKQGENSCCLIREGCPLQTVASVEMFPLPRLLKCHGRIAKTDRMLRGPYPKT
jgi:Bacterial regulatory proteins, luxR family